MIPFFIKLPLNQAQIQGTLRKAAIKGQIAKAEILPSDVTEELHANFSSPIVSEWPQNSSAFFNVMWSNFYYLQYTTTEEEIIEKFDQTAEKLRQLGFYIKDRHRQKFGKHVKMQVDGRQEQCALHLMSLVSRKPAKSPAKITEVAGPFVRPSGAHGTWLNPIYKDQQEEAGVLDPIALDRGIITFDINMTESLILFYKLTQLPIRTKRLWLKYFQPLLALCTSWGVAQTVLTGLKNFRDIRKYAARFETFIQFLRNQYFQQNKVPLETLLQNIPPAAITGWINLLVSDKKVSTIRGYIAAVNYFLKRLHFRPLQEINPALNCTLEGWRKLLAEEEGENATLALPWPRIVETFSIARKFFRDKKRFSPTCYYALIVSFWNALRTGEARELTFLQCTIVTDQYGQDNLISTYWNPKTGTKNRRHQHIILSDVAEQNYAFCPILNYKKALKRRLKDQICLFADQDGLPFREHEFYTIWREFFQKVRDDLNLGKGRYSFYTFRSSSITNYDVNFHMDEREIKAISRHTENSKVLKNSYLVKDVFQRKWEAARNWAQRFQTKEAFNLHCTKFDDFFEFNDWFEYEQ